MLKNLTLIILCSCSYAWAACTPETVNFYLEKGFNQEQITKLCSQASTPAPSYQPYQKPVVIVKQGYMPGMSEEASRAVRTLKGSIDGRSIDVTDNKINYISKLCLKAGNAPDLDKRITKCIDVAYSVSREDLRVRESGVGILFFGQETVSVTSKDVTRKLVVSDPWSAMSPEIALQLKRRYESLGSGSEVDIPLRRQASANEVIDAIRTLSSEFQNVLTGDQQSEVEKVLSDNYVPPTEEEYIASQPTYEQHKKEKDKDKKWWNPFD